MSAQQQGGGNTVYVSKPVSKGANLALMGTTREWQTPKELQHGRL